MEAEKVKPKIDNVEFFECGGCTGDGIWYGAGAVVNGVFQGKTGRCYRCNGKGYQTKDDMKRNEYYDNNVRRIY